MQILQLELPIMSEWLEHDWPLTFQKQKSGKIEWKGKLRMNEFAESGSLLNLIEMSWRIRHIRRLEFNSNSINYNRI